MKLFHNFACNHFQRNGNVEFKRQCFLLERMTVWNFVTCDGGDACEHVCVTISRVESGRDASGLQAAWMAPSQSLATLALSYGSCTSLPLSGLCRQEWWMAQGLLMMEVPRVMSSTCCNLYARAI